jgi:hypothetical protein
MWRREGNHSNSINLMPWHPLDARYNKNGHRLCADEAITSR